MDARDRDVIKRSANAFGDPLFNANSYVDTYLQTHSLDSIPPYRQDLNQQKVVSSKALRQIVFDQYKIFINSTKDIKSMNNELSSLKSIIAETDDLLIKMKSINLGITLDNTSKVKIVDGNDVSFANQWVIEILDDMDSYINIKKFNFAVDLTKKITTDFIVNNKDSETERINLKFLELQDKLCSEIISEISNSSDPARLKENTLYLYTLGKQKLSQHLYLENVSSSIADNIKSIKINPNHSSYFTELTKITFFSIKNTFNEFSKLFEKYDLPSLIVWCFNEFNSYITNFASLLKLDQISNVTRDQLLLFYECFKVIVTNSENNVPSGLNIKTHLLKKLSNYVRSITTSYKSEKDKLTRTEEDIEKDKMIFAFFKRLYPNEKIFQE